MAEPNTPLPLTASRSEQIFPTLDNGMIASQGEVRTDNKAISAAVERGDSSILRGRKESGGVNRRQAQLAGQTERPPSRQQEAVSRLQLHRVVNIIYR